jgi:hypothetical protein
MIRHAFLGLVFTGLVWAQSQLPPQEEAMKDTVDHWGLAFSDQLAAFNENLDAYGQKIGVKSPDYALGVETSLRKTFQNKYWFKGRWTSEVQITAGRNESESFQLAIIPKTGFELKDVNISVSEFRHVNKKDSISSGAMKLWRVGFVETAKPQYPVKNIGLCPDPLLEMKPFSLKGLDLGLVWCEIKVPADAAAGDYIGTLTVTPANSKPASLAVKLHVWKFKLPDRVPFPTMVWIKGDMKSDQYRDLCALFLEHHLDPISVGDTKDLAVLDRNLEFCLKRGLMIFQTPGFKKVEEFRPYYDHLVKKGWIDKAIIYSPCDEPTAQTLKEEIIPRKQLVQKEFPGLRTFLATQYYSGLDQGTDIWLTDVSTRFYSWLDAGRPGKQQLWWYFCHLPIHCTFERPLVDAPNMLIDNDAIEHRLPYWMTRNYDVNGIFIWSGNMDWPADTVHLTTKNMSFPYGGIHNGNGFLVYPGLVPSMRLKILRDGIEDYWYLTELEKISRSGPMASQAKLLLASINPEIFVDTHYFSRDPARMLAFREKAARLIEKAE